MSLNESQLYYIRKAISRKSKVVIAAVNRELGENGSAITTRIIKARITRDLHEQYQIERFADLSVSDYDTILLTIKSFRFSISGQGLRMKGIMLQSSPPIRICT